MAGAGHLRNDYLAYKGVGRKGESRVALFSSSVILSKPGAPAIFLL